jgi:acyl-CoA thioester hydrolase
MLKRMTGAERDLTSSDFPVHWPVHTRWTDNDMFGHLNNAVYYALFDTAINAWINTSTDIDPVTAPWLGVVAESGCRYFAELKFPDPLVVGLAVTRLGTSSVTYRLAVFASSWGERSDGEMVSTDAPVPVAAAGNWVHVYVDRSTRRPVPIPDAIRALLEPAVVEQVSGDVQ